jgi:phosphoglucosamine mutase
MLESAIASGLCSVGTNVILLGVVPTPAVAYLVKKYNADAGIMISASHNPFQYNGIKIFDRNGYKLSDLLEERIESLILDEDSDDMLLAEDSKLGKTEYCTTAVDDYINHIISTVDVDFKGIKVALDCSNGSSSRTAEKLFTKLGAEVFVYHAEPDGININKDCGSTHVSLLADFVIQNKCNLGLAFDGDADRCLAIDENGEIVDGDKIIAILAKRLKEEGKLNKDTAVVTVMSNLGFFKFAEANGINVSVSKVGDRYVLEEMLLEKFSIGGEQSGHIIFRDFASTGDGQLTGVQLIKTIKMKNKPLSELASIMTIYPQVLINVEVTRQKISKYYSDTVIQKSIEEEEAKLAGEGRILVRPSGTEPLIRVMVEGKNQGQTTAIAEKIAGIINERLN